MINDEIPNVLYHYASLDTFLKIIENKTIRLSDITKSNDSQEIIWIKRYIPEIFEAAYVAEKAKYFHERVPQNIWTKLATFYADYWFGDAHGYYSYYVFCLSGEEDLLSQWRGYADDGSGVSIGYDTECLRTLTRETSFHCELQAIIYSERQQKEHIRDVANELIDQIKTDIRSGKLNIPVMTVEEETGTTIIELKPYFEAALDKIYQFAPSMKNPFFRQEQEYRLSVLMPTVTKKSELFRHTARNNRLSSYIELKKPDLYEDKAHPLIRSVCIGPKCDVSEREIRAIMASNNMAGLTKVFSVNRSYGSYC